MEKKKKTPAGGNDDLGPVVDQLLRKLPHADPDLVGDRAPRRAAVRPAFARRAPAAKRGELGTLHRSQPPSPGPPATPAGAWARLALGIIFGIALTQWPYDRGCGFPTYLYLGAVGVVLTAACWSTIITWKLHMPAAHVGALLLLAWGGVLATREVLPRVGYAMAEASWRCAAAPTEQAPQAPSELQTAPPIVADSLAPVMAEPASLATQADSIP